MLKTGNITFSKTPSVYQKDEYYRIEECKDGANLHESSLENTTERLGKTFDKNQLREQFVFRCRHSVTEYIHVTSNPVMMINCHRPHRSCPRQFLATINIQNVLHVDVVLIEPKISHYLFQITALAAILDFAHTGHQGATPTCMRWFLKTLCPYQIAKTCHQVRNLHENLDIPTLLCDRL